MLTTVILNDILDYEESLVEYCKVLTNNHSVSVDDAQDTIKNYLGNLETYELLEIAKNRNIPISNERLVTFLVQEINGAEFIDMYPKTSTALKFLVAILNMSNDVEDLKIKILEMSDNEDMIMSCFR